MPVEIRDIVFSPRELRDALYAYGQIQEREMDGPALDVRLSDGTDVGARLVFQSGTVSFTSTEITAALIMYAKRESIPIPRRAQKELRIHNGQLGLRLRMT